MPLLNFFGDEKQKNTPIQKDIDPARYEMILSKLCAKRKLLEDSLAGVALDPKARENAVVSLMTLKSSMKTFGVGEVEYQVFLASLSAREPQPSLFE